MTVDTRENDRVIGHGRRQTVVRRKAGVRPVVLVPSPADQPGVGGQLSRAASDPLDDLFVAAGPDQVHGAQCAAETGQVTVRVDHPGDDGLAGDVDHSRSGTTQRRRFLVASDEDNAVAPNGERLGVG